jgi:hypothetical protein
MKIYERAKIWDEATFSTEKSQGSLVERNMP